MKLPKLLEWDFVLSADRRWKGGGGSVGVDSEYVDVKYEGVGALYCLHSLVKWCLYISLYNEKYKYDVVYKSLWYSLP